MPYISDFYGGVRFGYILFFVFSFLCFYCFMFFVRHERVAAIGMFLSFFSLLISIFAILGDK